MEKMKMVSYTQIMHTDFKVKAYKFSTHYY